MGGGGPQPPNLVGGGQTPINVPPFGQPQQPSPFYVPGQSLKGGSLSPLPSLQETFNRPLGGPPIFPNTQSFPQPVGAGFPQPSLAGPLAPIPLGPGGPGVVRPPFMQVPGAQPIPAVPPVPVLPAPARPQPEDRDVGGLPGER